MSTHENTSALRMQHAVGHKRTVLAASIALTLGGLSLSTSAAVFTLNFDDGVGVCLIGGTYPDCQYGASDVTAGSFFSMDADGNGSVAGNEKTPISRLNGVIVDGVTTQPASGSHTLPPDGTESPDIDQPWAFFGNTGMHQTTSPVGALTDDGAGNVTLDFSGWDVTWNGIDSIPMGGDSANFPEDTGIATLTCPGGTCAANGDTFTLSYDSHVALNDASNFGGVAYSLSMTGIISVAGSAPTANPDSARTIADNPVTISVLDNDTAPADDPADPTSVTVSTAAGNGTTDDTDPAGTITYTPNAGFTDQDDTFEYTVDNAAGTSNAATVTVTVTTNKAPQANDDPDATTSTAVLDKTPLVIDILANDTDVNNSLGQPGGIDPNLIDNNSVVVTNAPGNAGTCVANTDGTITYTQPSAAIATVDTCTYTVNDIDSSTAGALTSNAATVTITVTATESDWNPNLPSDIIPILQFEAGIGDPDQSIKPEKSYFSMQVSAGTLIYTPLEIGPDGGFVIGYDQPATGSHTGKSNGTEQPGLSAPWLFFSNTGFDWTRNGGITGNSDGTLEFFTKYAITWNGIAGINLGGSTQFPEDLGFATIDCGGTPCEDGSSFILDYAAHVEDVPGEEASGFNGVPYTLYLEGTVQFLDGNLQTSNGDITNQTRVAASETIADDGVDLQCAGSCFDYKIENVTDTRALIVLPLSGGIRNNPVWRILDNGVWRDFDTLLVAESVKTAPAIAGGPGLVCPAPDDAAYIDLENDTDVNLGHQCVQLSIVDNGPNDLNDTLGIIEDPSGQGTAGTPEFEDTRGSDTSGCSIATHPVSAAERGDWWLLAGLLGLLGWVRKRILH